MLKPKWRGQLSFKVALILQQQKTHKKKHFNRLPWLICLSKINNNNINDSFLIHPLGPPPPPPTYKFCYKVIEQLSCPKEIHHKKKSLAVWKKSKKGGGVMTQSELFKEPLVVVYVWKFLIQRGVSPKSKLVEELFCLRLNYF